MNSEEHYQGHERDREPSLVDLLTRAGTKADAGAYGRNYERYFRPLRERPLRILEIGVGGYASPNDGGETLRALKAYFPNAILYGLDVHDKKALEEPRISIFQGRQDDIECLKLIIERAGWFDIIIDDGSHKNADVITSFNVLFPHLSSNGIYCVEDTYFSYIPSFMKVPERDPDIHPFWKSYGGALDINAAGTMMAFFKSLADRLHHRDFISPGYSPSALDLTVVGVHFFRNQVFILKGDNSREGHICERNELRPEWLRSIGVQSMDELELPPFRL